jgi:hypothetical protein
MKNIFLCIISIITLSLSVISFNGYAIDSSQLYINAKVMFLSAVNLSSRDVTELAPYRSQAGIGKLSIGTDGNIIYGKGFYGNSKGNIEKLDIGISEVVTLDIYCSPKAIISNGRDRVAIHNIEMVMGSNNQAPAGSGMACSGLQVSSLSQVTQPLSNENTLFMGISVDGKEKAPNSENAYFNTSKHGGSSPSVYILHH